MEDPVDEVDPVRVALVRHVHQGDLQRHDVFGGHLSSGPRRQGLLDLKGHDVLGGHLNPGVRQVL